MTATKMKDAEFPFDLAGELLAMREKAAREGDGMLVRTLDAVLYRESDLGTACKYELRAWRAVRGDARSQDDLGWMFDWFCEEPEKRNPYWNQPDLAEYWYEKAAMQGHAGAQTDLGILLYHLGGEVKEAKRKPGKKLPDSVLSEGDYELLRRANYWWEKAAAAEQPVAMEYLAHCLTCGHCCKNGYDPKRAAELQRRAAEIKAKKKEGANK